MFRNLFFSLYFLSSFTLFAQTTHKITLEIRSESDGNPIPFAHAISTATHHGSVANKEGLLEISLSNADDSLKISAIGFQTKSIATASLSNHKVVLLEEDIIALSEVIVKYVDPAKELLKKAINQIPVNYSDVPTFLTGFTREGAYADSLHQQPYYQLETSTQILKETYSKAHQNGQVKLLKGRIAKTQLNDSLWTKFYSGTHLPHRFDYVMQRSGIFNLKKLDNYELEIIDTLTLDGKALFKLAYRSIKSQKPFDDYFYIQDQSFAIVKIEKYWRGKKSENTLGLQGEQYRILNNTVIGYRQLNNLWSLSNISYETAFERTPEIPKVYIQVDYITTKVEIAEKAEIPFEERLLYREITYDEVEKIDTTYWEDKSTLVLPVAATNLFAENSDLQLSNQPTALDQKQAFISKFSSGIGIGIRYFPLQQRSINYTNVNFNYSDTISESFMNAVYATNTLAFALNKNFILALNYQSSFKNKQYSSVQLGGAYRLKMNKKGRPFYSTMGLGLSHSWMNNELASIALNEPISINDTKFNSESMGISYGIREWALSPSYSLGVKLNSWFEIQFKVNYFLPIQRKQGFYFLEEDGFIRKDSFFKQETKSFEQLSGQQLNNIGCSIGLKFSL